MGIIGWKWRFQPLSVANTAILISQGFLCPRFTAAVAATHPEEFVNLTRLQLPSFLWQYSIQMQNSCNCFQPQEQLSCQGSVTFTAKMAKIWVWICRHPKVMEWLCQGFICLEIVLICYFLTVPCRNEDFYQPVPLPKQKFTTRWEGRWDELCPGNAERHQGWFHCQQRKDQLLSRNPFPLILLPRS